MTQHATPGAPGAGTPSDHHRAAPTIEDHLEQLRGTYRRVNARDAALAVEQGALLVDIRPLPQRVHEGEVPGALIIDRNVLEWRLAPTSAHRVGELTGPDHPVIVMCSEGYASTLAAVSLRALGLTAATDLVGGFHAWVAEGLPAVDPRRPPASHLTAV